ncbi:MAG: class I SAM-dependent methyltransferase [Chitinophagaceae bacterium]|nr:class I SAM-dependent methyltransferase [Chitinophagaceae bacterium]
MTPTDNTGNQVLNVIADADKFNNWMYQSIKPFAYGSILEVGSGIGNISKYFIQNNYSITLSDVDEFYLNHLKKDFLNSSNAKDFISIDLQKKDFQTEYENLKESFDTIIMLNVLEHLENDEYAIKNCRFMLKDNGSFIILVPAYRFLYSAMDKELNHYRRYTSRSLKRKIIAGNFTIRKSFYFNFLGIFAWLYGKIFRIKVPSSAEMKLFNKLVPLGKVLDKIVFKSAGLSIIVVAKKLGAKSE